MKKILLSAIIALGFSGAALADPLANYLPGFRTIDGSQLNKMVAVVNSLTGTGTLQPLTATTITGTSASANALAVGRLGATNPVLKVNASATTVATGLSITGAAAASGVAVAAISSGTNENLTLDAKGSGTITLGSISTGNIVLTRATTGLSFSGTGLLTSRSATATPAAASAVPALSFGSGAIGIYWGTGSPSTALTAVKGSVYIRTDGSTTNDRMYINTDGVTAWTNVTTAG